MIHGHVEVVVVVVVAVAAAVNAMVCVLYAVLVIVEYRRSSAQKRGPAAGRQVRGVLGQSESECHPYRGMFPALCGCSQHFGSKNDDEGIVSYRIV